MINSRQYNEFVSHPIGVCLVFALPSIGLVMPTTTTEYTSTYHREKLISMKAIFNGSVLAESDDIVYVDGNAYFPREAMHVQYFRDSRHTTVCGWKGKARYWDLIVDDQILTNVAWSYETPKPDAEAIRYRFAFYSGKGVVVA